LAKTNLVNFPMFGASGADLSQSTVTSTVTDVRYEDNLGILVSWTGSSPSGSLQIQVSNDYNALTGSAGTWIALSFGSALSISGNSGSFDVSIAQLPYAYIRAVYTKVSGSGTLFANLTGKRLGG